MNKTELIKNIAAETELTQGEVTTVVNKTFEKIANALAEGEKVSIVDFGTFESREMSERLGRNPRNSEEKIVIPAKMKPAFKPSKKLKEKVNE